MSCHASTWFQFTFITLHLTMPLTGFYMCAPWWKLNLMKDKNIMVCKNNPYFASYDNLVWVLHSLLWYVWNVAGYITFQKVFVVRPKVICMIVWRWIPCKTPSNLTSTSTLNARQSLTMTWTGYNNYYGNCFCNKNHLSMNNYELWEKKSSYYKGL